MKRLVGVTIEEEELQRMTEASKVDSASTAVLALARIGLDAMNRAMSEIANKAEVAQ